MGLQFSLAPLDVNILDLQNQKGWGKKKSDKIFRKEFKWLPQQLCF